MVFWACLAALGQSGTVGAAVTIDLTLIAAGQYQTVGITHADDTSDHPFIPLKGGQIVSHDGAAILPTPFLDIPDVVSTGGGQGLLDAAFHPDYAVNGFF
jgi:hypothetical protein